MASKRKQSSKSSKLERKLRTEMCDVGQRIWTRGLCAGNEGNHSCRISKNRILCTPSGMSKGTLKPDDLSVCDLDGKQISGKRKRTSEIFLHLAIYNEREEIQAVVHGHPPHATAFAIAGVDLPTCIHPEAEVFLGKVPTAAYVTPGDQRLGDSIKPHIASSNTILLGSHGVVCYGTSLEDAYYKFEIVDAYARILLLVKQLGSINTFDVEAMKGLMALKNRFGLSDGRTLEGEQPANQEFVKRVGR